MVTRSTQLGTVSFWTLTATPHAALADALESIGFKDFTPERTTPFMSLYNALRSIYPQKLVRQLKKNGFTVVTEETGEDENAYSSSMTAKLEVADGDGEPALKITGGTAEEQRAVHAGYRAGRDMVSATSVGQMLARIARDKASATLLRPTGGIYWIAEKYMQDWRRVSDAVERAGRGNRIYAIHHELDADAVRAVHDSLIEEMRGNIERLTREINSGELKERALTSREAEARSLASKVKEYEIILGTSLAALKAELESVETAAATAVMLASAVAA